MEKENCSGRDDMGSGDSTLQCEGLPVHTFQADIMNQTVYFQIIKFSDSFHLWVGTSSTFGDMSVAMNTKYSTLPTGCVLVGQSESISLAMAQRLSKRTGKQVFVSCSLPFDQMVIPLVEKRIAEELQTHPEMF